MNTFDRICAASAGLLGVILLLLGLIGLFAGCKAQFTLPPVIGVLPALVGWGILKAVKVAWNVPPGGRRNPPNWDNFTQFP